jgi:hypothetical protein
MQNDNDHLKNAGDDFDDIPGNETDTGGTIEPETVTVFEKSLFQQIQDLTVSEKIILARQGSKEARTILIRDSNKLVQISVINSPKITDSEVLAIANNRQINDEVLRIISKNREWMKNYQVKVALANNTKTPLTLSLKLIPYLQQRELALMSKSKNVPRVLALAALRKLQGSKW